MNIDKKYSIIKFKKEDYRTTEQRNSVCGWENSDGLSLKKWISISKIILRI